MGAAAYILAAILVLAVALVGVGIFIRAYWTSRGRRVVTCPETGKPAGVDLDKRHVAVTSVGGRPNLRLSDCSRWPEREACGQECLEQIRQSPEGCLVRSMLTQWYQDKACYFCGKTFGDIHWMDHKPALLDMERKILEWEEVPAEHLPGVLETHLPVCFDCNVAETFRRLYPDLVTDRPPQGGEPDRKNEGSRGPKQ